jgi:hypothetical protein
MSALVGAKSYIIFDNVNHRLMSEELHIALTADVFTGRHLGKTGDVSMPCDQVFIATGINVALGGQIPRRCFWVNIDSREVRPQEREGFKKPNIVQWALQNRADIINAIATMVYAWINEGKPLWQGRTIGNYNDWAKPVGGILKVAGSVGFMEKTLEQQMDSDEEEAELTEMCEGWIKYIGRKPVLLREAASHVFADTGTVSRVLSDFGLCLPESLAIAFEEKSFSSFVQSFGQFLKRHSKARFGDNEYEIVRVRPTSKTKKSSRWQVFQHKNMSTDDTDGS